MRLAPPYLYYKTGRDWMQRTELLPYILLSNHGMTGINWPRSAPTQIRAQSTSARAGSLTVAVTQGDKDLASFTISTSMRESANTLLALEDELVHMQLALGPAGQPTQYGSTKYGLGWVFAMQQPGTTATGAVADNAGEGLQVPLEFPFAATLGPIPIDWSAALARRVSVDDAAAMDIYTLPPLKDGAHYRRVLPGEVGMIVHDSLVGPALGEIYYFLDGWRTAPTNVTTDPFAAGDGCLSVVGYGDKYTNRFIVSSETAAAPTGAYTDNLGVTWTGFTFGAVAGDLPSRLWIVDAGHIWCVGGQAASSKIWYSVDGGATWTETDPGLAQPLADVQVMGDGIGYACGAANTVMKITNWNSYSALTGPAAGAGDANLALAIKVSSGTLFMGNDAGELYVSQDEGVTWVAVTASMQGVGAVSSVNHIEFDPGSGEYGFMEVTCAGPDRRLLRTTDGGTTWLPYSLGQGVDNIAKNGLHCYGPNDCWQVGELDVTAVVEEVTTDFDGKRQR